MTTSTYLIRKTDNFTPEVNAAHWKNANILHINNWPWHKESYSTPEVSARVLYSPDRLYVKFDVSENITKAVLTKYQNKVCRDSCIEFFVSCNEKEYFNFEVNAIGSMLLFIGEERMNRRAVPKSDTSDIDIFTSLPKGIPFSGKKTYQAAYSAPFKLFTKYTGVSLPESNTIWKGNFYKCGDRTPEPSWGSWAPIETTEPDFHRPEYFGNLIFE